MRSLPRTWNSDCWILLFRASSPLTPERMRACIASIGTVVPSKPPGSFNSPHGRCCSGKRRFGSEKSTSTLSGSWSRKDEGESGAGLSHDLGRPFEGSKEPSRTTSDALLEEAGTDVRRSTFGISVTRELDVPMEHLVSSNEQVKFNTLQR